MAGLAFALLFAVFSLPALAGSGDADFLAARQAFASGNRDRLDALADKLRDHVLYPYVAYYQLRLRLKEADPDEIRGFLEKYRGTVLAERLRGDWLRLLGQNQDWGLFTEEYPLLVGDDDELRCYALRARLAAADEGVLKQARALWFSGRELPRACTPLFDALVSAGKLNQEDVWKRLRVALAFGRVSLAREVNQYLPDKEALKEAALRTAQDHPERYLKHRLSLKTRGERELALFALQRIARMNPEQAHDIWTKLAHRFPARDRRYLWGRLAYYAALKHQPQALEWFERADPQDDELLAWEARAALRAQDWGRVLEAVDAMSPQEQEKSAWRYWKARALKSLGRETEANGILADLSRNTGFYGQLAAEDLGTVIGEPAPSYHPTKEEIAAAANVPGIQRALALYRLGLRVEATREWNWSIRDFDDKKLLAAAEVARQHELYDRAIYTAEKTMVLHDYSLRYIAPYRELLVAAARDMDLDEAWVYGLIRQESRFVPNARSSAGALGLMQLMPATARWVASRIGLRDYRSSWVDEVRTNVTLGLYYLRHVFTALGNQPVLASAAYNAGPARAQRWRDDKPMEGAIYAETIPLNETRDYVKKVMSNAEHYATAFGQRWRSLKERLGVIPPKSGDEGTGGRD